MVHALTQDYVLVDLKVDDRTRLPEEVPPTTYGDKWAQLQHSKYGIRTQPFFAIEDAAGQVQGTHGYFSEVEGLIGFLELHAQ